MNKTQGWSLFSLLPLPVLLAALQLHAGVSTARRFSHLTIEHGLSNNSVLCVLRDSQGFMWFGTEDGLNRYDGYRFEIYRATRGDSTTLSGNLVRCLLEDSFGLLWVGTSHGLNRYDRDSGKFRQYGMSHGPQRLNLTVQDMVEDAHGGIWIASDNGLWSFDRKSESLTRYANQDYAGDDGSSNRLRCVWVYDDHHLWLGTRTGVKIFDTILKKFSSHTYFDGRQYNVRSIRMSENGTIWLGTRSSGVYYGNPATGKWRNYRHDPTQPHSLISSEIMRINLDDEGIWFCSTDGLSLLPKGSRSRFVNFKQISGDETALSSNTVTATFKDPTGRLWVTTRFGGINIYDPHRNKFQLYQFEKGNPGSLSHDNVTSFDEDDKGNIWIGTDGGGVNYFDRSTGRFKRYLADPMSDSGPSNNKVLAVQVADDGEVLIGMWGGGLNILNPATNKFKRYWFDPDDSTTISSNNIFDIYQDHRGDLWVATFDGGLNRFDKKQEVFQRFSYDTSDSTGSGNPHIVHVVEDHEGKLWLAMEYGLDVLNQSRTAFRHYNHNPGSPYSLSHNTVTSVFEDAQNRLWVGTSGGLNLHKKAGDRFLHLTVRDGLPADRVVGILQDQNNRLWISTSNGLSRIEILEESEDSLRVRCKNYSASDGLQSRQFVRWAFFKSRNGEFFFGGIKGFNSFRPEHILMNATPPPIVFVSFQLFNRPVTAGTAGSPLTKAIEVTEEIVLSHRQSVFTLEFAALDYTYPLKNQYAFMMEGFDASWRYVGNKHAATYTNLDPGNYTFRVKAANSDGTWNEQGKSIRLTITPPFWATTWFRLVAGVLIGALVFGVYRLRVKNIAETNRRLENEVAVRTDQLQLRNLELKEQKEALETTLKELNETRKQLVEHAHKAGMADVATGVLHNIGNILNSINTRASTLKDIVDDSKVRGLRKANALLRDNLDNIEEFILHNPKGRKLLEYYLRVEDEWNKENTELMNEMEGLHQGVTSMNAVVASQQQYAKGVTLLESVRIADVVKESLTLFSQMKRPDCLVETNMDETVETYTQRSKVTQILINLLRNASDALASSTQPKIRITVSREEKYFRISIEDNGSGISGDQLERIFTHGYTTKEHGHGFGLHICANHATEMGGRLFAESEGPGKGARFILLLPLSFKKRTGSEEKVQLVNQ